MEGMKKSAKNNGRKVYLWDLAMQDNDIIQEETVVQWL